MVRIEGSRQIPLVMQSYLLPFREVNVRPVVSCATRWHKVVPSLLAALMLAACGDEPTSPSASGGPASAILEGAHGGGNPHFHWLRPMVASPSSFSGTFDALLAPEVRICALTSTTPATCEGGDIAVFSMTTGAGSEIVRMEPGEEQYIVNWHTDRYNLDPAKVYRVRVYVGSYELGSADVEVGASRKELEDVDTNEYVALLNGRTLPIKFRIEEGAVPAGERSIVSTSGSHSCALATGGQAYCWGTNAYGELGSGTMVHSAAPMAVAGGHAFTEIVTGFHHTCALKADGSAWCWGYNGGGSVGKGSYSYSELAPVAVAGGHQFTALAAGYWHTCGLKADGTALCWGIDSYGQVGNDALSDVAHFSPVAVAGGHKFQSLSAGAIHTCGVRASDAAAYCWGFGGWAQLGIGNALLTRQPTPAAVQGGISFESIHAGTRNTCAVTAAGAAYCWGQNYAGTVGNGSVAGYVYAPAAVVMPAATSFRALTVGELHACALAATDGTAYCWGYNGYGQLGIGSFTGKNVPTQVHGTAKYAAIDAGAWGTCAVTTTGAGQCWGYDGYGQLGDGTFGGIQATPGTVAGGLTYEAP